MVLKKIASIGTGLTMVAIIVFIARPALAETDAGINNNHGIRMGMMRGDRVPPMMKPAVLGSVTSINGTTLTLTGRVTPGNNASTTYNVDASHAKVFKDRATTTISSITTGDMIFVEGNVSGSNVTATVIRDGVKGVGFGPGKREGDHPNASSTPAFTGNGQPLVAGKISAVNGNTLTVTTGNGVAYTVDASNAKIVKGKDITTLSSVAVNDGVLVQGAVNGSSIVASTVIEEPKRPTQQNTNPTDPKPAEEHGLIGNLGGFFMHLFGF